KKQLAGEESIERALAVHQPFAELIVIGKKKREYHSRPINLQERVCVFACQRMDVDDRDVCEVRGIEVDSLPRGVLVGSVDIVGCKWNDERGCYAWLLKNTEKFF